LRWLPWAEFCYNTAYQASIRTMPFQVVYGCDPPALRGYDSGSVRIQAVEQTMAERDEFIAETKDRLEQSQQFYKAQYDHRHRPVEFEVGAWVWLRLLQRPAASLNVRGRQKLGPKFYGPFQITERIGSVAYRLQLPASARLHDVFHVGLLKPFRGDPPSSTPALPPIPHGRVCVQPERMLHSRLARDRLELLVQWKGRLYADAE